VVDTGIDVGGVSLFGAPDDKHPDLAICNRTVEKKSYVAWEDGNDDNGHGTHIAGVIGACTNTPAPGETGIAGANWAVTLMAIKVLDYSGGGTWSAVANGIRYAADNGAKVINLSLGGNRGSNTLRSAVDYAWNRGAVLVCAAGNGGNSARSYPAYYANCLAVAATTQADTKASFSTYGNWVEVAAPGAQIFSLMQDTWEWCFLCWGYGYYEGYDTLNGTSMATAVVSGLAALIWSVPGLCSTNGCVRARIENTADPIAGTGQYWSKGRVNFSRAVGGP
jgi:thermitase